MSTEKEYYINLYVGGKFVSDPHVRYSGGETVRLKEDPDTISYFELCKIVKNGLSFNTMQLIYFYVPGNRTLQYNLRAVWNDSSTIDMLNNWVKHKKINIYVEHEIDTVIFANDDLMLAVGTVEGASDGNEGVEVAGSKGGERVVSLNGDSVEVAGGEGGEGGTEVAASKGGERVEGLSGNFVEVSNSLCGDGGEGGKGIEVAGNQSSEGGEGSVGVKGLDGLDASVEWLEEGDGGLNSNVDEDGKEGVEDESDSDLEDENFYLKHGREVEGKTNGKFKETVLDKTESESFEERELKIVNNEPNRVRVKCIASKINMSKCMQVKIFHDEHNCGVSFRNKMINVKVNANNSEATIKDHSKMKLTEIQRRVALEMHVNVNMTRCRRAKKMVKDKLVGNFVEEFVVLCDYADELRLKNPGSTIKMAVNRVTYKSPPHFKRFYVCFEALNKCWKEGCILILRLDGCLLKGPFKSEIFFAVERDRNNQIILTTDLGMEDGYGYTIISDEQKIHEGVAKELLSKYSKAWTKAFQGLHSVSGIVDNNLYEAFNSSIVESRLKSIITMLEEIRVKMMTKIVDKGK
uniref:PB1-like domain-containing protein n=1 Tax=Gossypium raimondii TaxID=29730 RepID=A0A0D2QH31_GOSRA|nr:hypothetical protein B456_003G077800 [Gossypium raimondii]